jgi:hypothetical protein
MKSLVGRGNTLFGRRQTLMTLWQEIADNFYVERADFTRFRILGEEFADHLHSSYPLLVRRELGNAFSSMLRPLGINWFDITIEDDKDLSIAAREWLEMATYRQRQAMYDRRALFTRATKEGDHDFAAFGQCIIEREIDWQKTPPALLYRCWHLRDVAWAEKYDGAIGEIHRKWKPSISTLVRAFPNTVSEVLKERVEKTPQAEVDCRVITIETEELHDELLMGEFQHPWAKIIIDVQNDTVLLHDGRWTSGLTIPRWQTVSGSQYGYSPATVAGLPDARLIQAMTLTLLEAGEMAVRPAVIASQDVIRSDINLYPGGITWVDADYDERKGEVLQPITQDLRGIGGIGFDMQEDMRAQLSRAFYLDKLSLPDPGQGGMSPFEMNERIQQYIRDALPLFEPMEVEYNGGLCEDTFDALMHAGVFGPPSDVPRELRGANIRFRFTSPLHDSEDRKQAATFMETAELLRVAVEMDPTSQFNLDSRVALRDAMKGMGVPATWMRTPEEVDEAGDEMAQMQNMAEQAQMAQEAGAAVEQVGKGGEAIKQLTNEAA